MLISLLVFVGCNGGPGLFKDRKANDSGDSGEVSACDGTGYQAAETWELPDQAVPGKEYPYSQISGSSDADNCGSDNHYDLAVTTADLTGDGIPDLIITRDDCGSANVGRSRWTVYRGTGSGFGDAETWELPDQAVPGNEYPYSQLSGSSDADNCGSDSHYDLALTTTDLTGDGMPDLVITRDDCGETGVGRSQWTIYPGSCE